MSFLYLDEIKSLAKSSECCGQDWKPPTRNDEVDRLAENLVKVTAPQAMPIAIAWHLCFMLLSHLGNEHGVDLTPVVDVVRSALHALAHSEGLESSQVQVALNHLARAGQIAEYLSTIPD